MTEDTPQRNAWTVGEMAARVGVATHVLRHWEDEGLLRPERTASGYRRYRLDDLIRILAIQHNQRAGMGLPEIRALLDHGNADRHRILEAHLAKLDELAREIEHSRAMTEHALRCRNHDISSCPRFADIVGEVAESDGHALPPDFAHFPATPTPGSTGRGGTDRGGTD